MPLNSSDAPQLKVSVLQDGARLHYALPLALQKAGLLDRVYTEWYSSPGSFQRFVAGVVAKFNPALGRRMLGRWCQGLDPARVRTFALRMLWDTYRFRHLARWRLYQAHGLSAGRWLCRHGILQSSAVMSFVTVLDAEMCRRCKEAGVLLVGDEIIAPTEIVLEEARRQAQRWPGWELAEDFEGAEVTAQQEREVWSLLDHITCASDYVRDGLISKGVAPERIDVLPYPIDATHFKVPDRRGRSGPLTVGFVGGVNLRKGAPWFLETARMFDPAKVRFVMVGPGQVQPAAMEELKKTVEIVGRVPRSEVAQWMEKFDVFFFPSTCEGSAGAVMEAMASGLPIVTTPNSGTVVRHGVEGFIAPVGEVERMAEHIRQLVDDPERRWAMGAAARRRAEEFNIDWYSRELGKLFERLGRRRAGNSARTN